MSRCPSGKGSDKSDTTPADPAREAVTRAELPAQIPRSQTQGVAAWIGAIIDRWREGPDTAERHGPGGGPTVPAVRGAEQPPGGLDLAGTPSAGLTAPATSWYTS